MYEEKREANGNGLVHTYARYLYTPVTDFLARNDLNHLTFQRAQAQELVIYIVFIFVMLIEFILFLALK